MLCQCGPRKLSGSTFYHANLAGNAELPVLEIEQLSGFHTNSNGTESAIRVCPMHLTCLKTHQLLSMLLTPVTGQIYNIQLKRRAVEATMCGMLLINFQPMRVEINRDLCADPNIISYFSRPLDWHFKLIIHKALLLGCAFELICVIIVQQCVEQPTTSHFDCRGHGCFILLGFFCSC